MKADVLIIGGGIVGLTTALGLSKQDLSIVLLDKNPRQVFEETESYSLRVSAITRASQRLFEKLNVWQMIKNERKSPFENMFVWDHEGTGQITFNANEVMQPYLGHIIENGQLIEALYKNLAQCSNVSLLFGIEPQRLEIVNHLNVVTLKNGDTITSKLLIGSDGADSWVRARAKIAFTQKPYHQSALVTTVRTEKSHELTHGNASCKKAYWLFYHCLMKTYVPLFGL